MEFFKFLGFLILGVMLGRFIVKAIVPDPTTPDNCKLHNWSYDMDSGKYVCIRCRGRSGEM